MSTRAGTFWKRGTDSRLTIWHRGCSRSETVGVLPLDSAQLASLDDGTLRFTFAAAAGDLYLKRTAIPLFTTATANLGQDTIRVEGR